MVGESMYYGPGAGGDATASAVVADIIDIARGANNLPMLGFKKSISSKQLTLVDREEIHTKYYLRIEVEDKVGVLYKIAKVLGDFDISISSFLQKQKRDENHAILLLSTHKCFERDIQKAIKELNGYDFIKQSPVMIRIED